MQCSECVPLPDKCRSDDGMGDAMGFWYGGSHNH